MGITLLLAGKDGPVWFAGTVGFLFFFAPSTYVLLAFSAEGDRRGSKLSDTDD